MEVVQFLVQEKRSKSFAQNICLLLNRCFYIMARISGCIEVMDCLSRSSYVLNLLEKLLIHCVHLT